MDLTNINKKDGNQELDHFPGSSLGKLNYSKKSELPDFNVPSGCAVFGVLNENGTCISGRMAIDGIAMMHERSNGLGGGFAAYGIYPEYRDDWVFHILYDDNISRKNTEVILKDDFEILYYERIPTRNSPAIKNPPQIYRYFLKLMDVEKHFVINKAADRLSEKYSEENFIASFVLDFNSDSKNGSYIISSGKNMGIFKGVGFPEDIGNYFRLDDYKGYIWTAHGRFPTNSIGWWGGAHPFGLLNWSVVHNGEISSYGRNQRFVRGFGYKCSLSTDTEVLAYLIDLLVRRSSISIELVSSILAAPLWEQIERMDKEDRELYSTLRILYGGALVNGPFSIIVGSNDFMFALNDRIKLRPMVAAKKDDFLFVSSEESSIRKVSPVLDKVWHPNGGEPVIGFVKGSEKENVIKT